MANDSSKSTAGFIGGLLAGVVAGCFAGSILFGGGGYVLAQKRIRDARHGWNLNPIVVAAEDIPKGTVLTFDVISQRSVPEQFVTSSIVKPDSASYIVNQTTAIDIHAGDPIRWVDFEGVNHKRITSEGFMPKDANEKF